MKRPANKSYSVRQLVKKMEKNQLNFDFPIQRESGQWDKNKKGLFIHTLIHGYDVPPVYMINEETESFTKSSVADGKQRLTTIFEYYQDGFKLPKNMTTVLDGQSYDISEMKFSELPEDLQEEFLDYLIDIKLLNGFTDEEIEEQFYRLNNGETFTRPQKANVKLGTELADKISDITDSNFFKLKASFSKKQVKAAEPLSCVLQTLMLLTGFDYKNMSNNEVLRFAVQIGQEFKDGKFSAEQIDYCKYLYERLYAILPDDKEVKKSLKKVNIPTVIMNLEKMEALESEGMITEEQYKEFLKWWYTEGILSEDYTATCGAGATGKVKTDDRINVMEDALLEFIDNYDSLNKETVVTTESSQENIVA